MPDWVIGVAGAILGLSIMLDGVFRRNKPGRRRTWNFSSRSAMLFGGAVLCYSLGLVADSAGYTLLSALGTGLALVLALLALSLALRDRRRGSGGDKAYSKWWDQR